MPKAEVMSTFEALGEDVGERTASASETIANAVQEAGNNVAQSVSQTRQEATASNPNLEDIWDTQKEYLKRMEGLRA